MRLFAALVFALALVPVQAPTITITPPVQEVHPREWFTVDVVVTSATPVTIAVSADPDLAFEGLDDSYHAAPGFVTLPLPSGTTTTTLRIGARALARMRTAEITAFVSDTPVTTAHVTIGPWRAWLPLVNVAGPTLR